MVPTVVDLTTVGSSGTINNAIFEQFTPGSSTGTGRIDSFLRVQATGTERGYNTDYRPLQFDELTSANFTRSLALSSIPVVVDAQGHSYYEFLLDINQEKNSPLLSLDELRLFESTSATEHNYDTATNKLNGISALYDMDAGSDSYVKMDFSLNPGSGAGDVVVLMPVSVLGADPAQYVYLFSRFGDHNATNEGFEEWAEGTQGTAVSPVGTISGHKFNDHNGNGIQDSGDQALQGITIYLDQNNDAMLDNNEVSTTTDANGNFTFQNVLAGGPYRVREVVPSGYMQTTTNPSDINLTPGQTVSGVLFGNHLISADL